jgi:hypothetical protein
VLFLNRGFESYILHCFLHLVKIKLFFSQIKKENFFFFQSWVSYKCWNACTCEAPGAGAITFQFKKVISSDLYVGLLKFDQYQVITTIFYNATTCLLTHNCFETLDSKEGEWLSNKNNYSKLIVRYTQPAWFFFSYILIYYTYTTARSEERLIKCTSYLYFRLLRSALYSKPKVEKCEKLNTSIEHEWSTCSRHRTLTRVKYLH